jgi:NDP-sugar pyrophosphorylase family protein
VVVRVVFGVVLAGGEGVRLRPLIRNFPKALLKIAGKPLYVYSLEELLTVTKNVAVVAPPGRGSLFNLAPRVVEQPIVGDLDSAVKLAVKEAEKENEDVLLLSFTGFLSAPRGMASSTLEYYSSSGYQVVITVVPVLTGLETYGFVDMAPSGSVKAYIPPGKGPAEGAGYVFAGLAVASTSSARILAEKGFENGLNILAEEGVLGALVWHGDWVEIGYPWDLLEAKRVVLQLVQPVIDPSAVIGKEVVIEGRVAVCRGAKLSPGAVIEGPTFIGENARLEPGSYVKSSLIEPGSTIGSMATVKDSVVLESSMIGSYSLLENSVVGPFSVIGAYTLVEAGEPKRLPERIAGMEKILKIKARIGAVIGESSTIPPRTTLEAGRIWS